MALFHCMHWWAISCPWTWVCDPIVFNKGKATSKEKVESHSPASKWCISQDPACQGHCKSLVKLSLHDLQEERAIIWEKSGQKHWHPGSAAWWYACYQLLSKVRLFQQKALVTKLEIFWNCCWNDLEVLQQNRLDRCVREEQFIKAQGSNFLSERWTRYLVKTSEDSKVEMPKNFNCLNFFRCKIS